MQAIADMDKKLKAVELKLITESDMMSDDKYYPEQYQLYMNLIWLGGEIGNGAGDVAGSGDYGPTETDTALVLDLERELDGVKTQYKGVMDKDVPAFNQTVGASGVPPLKTTGAPPAPVRAGRGGGDNYYRGARPLADRGRIETCGLIAALLLSPPLVQVRAQSADWKQLEFMLGKWIGAAGEKDTPNGAGGGAFSFEPDLNKKIIVRHNNASYDSGLKHDDLMVIYTEGGTRAIYFDREGHVIHYNVSAPSLNRLVFESDGTQLGPKYRLSYWLDGGSLDGKFEIAACLRANSRPT